MRKWLILLQLVVLFIRQSCAQCEFTDNNDDCDSDTVAVRLGAVDEASARSIAEKHGYILEGKIGSLDGYYLLKKRRGRIAKRHALETLGQDTSVFWHEVQLPKKRVKRDLLDEPLSKRAAISPATQFVAWSDPMYPQQWFLRKGAVGGYDMFVNEAWQLGVSGKNVVVSILDDGIQGTHPDLAPNYDPKASTDINGKDDDPMPQDNGDNKHGTRCAGEVAAVAGNSWCGVGVAFNASIGGVRMLDGPVSDSVEAASLSLNPLHIDIYSASWGPEDDGKTVDGPGPLAKEAFYQGITRGRAGKGNIFIWASGNGGSHQDSCSCDGYTTSIYTLSVSSATFDNQKPWYLEECPSTLTTTYSSAGPMQPAIVTVDMPNACTDSHTGTSASAPLAAGIVALALEANPNLTWRDMQHLVVRTSNPEPLLQNSGWSVNGVGRKVSNKFGYGLMHAEKLVKLARLWKAVPPQHTCSYESHIEKPNPRPLVGRFALNFTANIASVGGGCQGQNAVNFLEHVQAIVSIQYSRRGDLKVSLQSPSGTKSILLPPRPLDVSSGGFSQWPFLSVQQWGEDPRGTWTLTIENVGSSDNKGTFHGWRLAFFGTEVPAQPDDTLPPAHQVETTAATTTGSNGSSQSPKSGGVLYVGCHAECDPTKGCTRADSAGACVACRNYLVRKRNRSGDVCVPRCEKAYWVDEATKKCHACPVDCATCSNSNECDTCAPPLLLILSDTPDVVHVHHGRCRDACPASFMLNHTPTGDVCSPSRSVDGRCPQGLFLSHNNNNLCVERCADGQFASGDFKCLPCHASCAICMGASADDCIECAVGYARKPPTNGARCEPSPTGQTNVVSTTWKPCQEMGQYYDSVLSNECRPCPGECQQELCVGPATQCSVCWTNATRSAPKCTVLLSDESGARRWSFASVAALFTAFAVLVFFVVFGALMYRDRHGEGRRNGNSYSKLPSRGLDEFDEEGFTRVNGGLFKNGVKRFTPINDEGDLANDFSVLSDDECDTRGGGGASDTLFTYEQRELVDGAAKESRVAVKS